MAVAKIARRPSPNAARPELGSAALTAATAPSPVWLRARLISPTVPAGLVMIHRPARIIAVMAAASPTESAMRRRTIAW